MPSMHQVDTLNALAAQPNVSVTLAYERPLYAEYEAQGWTHAGFSEAIEAVDLGAPESFARLTSRRSPADVHIFTGFFSHPLVWKGFHALVNAPVRRFAYSEAFDPRGWKGPLRMLRARIKYRRWGDRLDGVLAFGVRGMNYFRAAGVPESKLIQFGYYFDPLKFPSHSTLTNNSQPSTNRPFDFLYVGRFIQLKGLDYLLRAWSRAEFPLDQAKLTLLGNGPEESKLKSLATQLGINNLHFEASVPHDRALERVAVADCLILPSQCDGWGAPISEALHCGVPVIATDRCGAYHLLDRGERGQVVSHRDEAGLTRALEAQFRKGYPTFETRDRIRQWVQREISASDAAKNLLLVLQGKKSI